jgi:hypothetical protein
MLSRKDTKNEQAVIPAKIKRELESQREKVIQWEKNQKIQAEEGAELSEAQKLHNQSVLIIGETIRNQAVFFSQMKTMSHMLHLFREKGVLNDPEKKVLDDYLTQTDNLLKIHEEWDNPTNLLGETEAYPEQILKKLNEMHQSEQFVPFMEQLAQMSGRYNIIHELYVKHMDEKIFRSPEMRAFGSGLTLDAYLIMATQRIPRIELVLKSLRDTIKEYSKENKKVGLNSSLETSLESVEEAYSTAHSEIERGNILTSTVEGELRAKLDFENLASKSPTTRKTDLFRNILNLGIGDSKILGTYVPGVLERLFPEDYKRNTQGTLLVKERDIEKSLKIYAALGLKVDLSIKNKFSSLIDLKKTVLNPADFPELDLNKKDKKIVEKTVLNPEDFNTQALEDLYIKDKNPVWLILKSIKPVDEFFTAEQKIRAFAQVALALKNNELGPKDKSKQAYELAKAAMKVAEKHPEGVTVFAAQFGPESELGSWIIKKTKGKKEKESMTQELGFTELKVGTRSHKEQLIEQAKRTAKFDFQALAPKERETASLRNMMNFNLKDSSDAFGAYTAETLVRLFPNTYSMDNKGTLLVKKLEEGARIYKALGLDAGGQRYLDPVQFNYVELDNLYALDKNNLWLILKSKKPVDGENFTAAQKIRAYAQLAQALKDGELGPKNKSKQAYELAKAAMEVVKEYPESARVFTTAFGPESKLGSWIIDKTSEKKEKELVGKNLNTETSLDPAKFNHVELDNLYARDNNKLWLVLKSKKPVDGENFTASQKIQTYAQLAQTLKNEELGPKNKSKQAYELAKAAMEVVKEYPESAQTFTAAFGPESTLGSWIIDKTSGKKEKELVTKNLNTEAALKPSDDPLHPNLDIDSNQIRTNQMNIKRELQERRNSLPLNIQPNAEEPLIKRATEVEIEQPRPVDILPGHIDLEIPQKEGGNPQEESRLISQIINSYNIKAKDVEDEYNPGYTEPKIEGNSAKLTFPNKAASTEFLRNFATMNPDAEYSVKNNAGEIIARVEQGKLKIFDGEHGFREADEQGVIPTSGMPAEDFEQFQRNPPSQMEIPEEEPQEGITEEEDTGQRPFNIN